MREPQTERGTEWKGVIWSDSTAALLALKGRKSEARSDLIVELLVTFTRVKRMENIL